MNNNSLDKAVALKVLKECGCTGALEFAELQERFAANWKHYIGVMREAYDLWKALGRNPDLDGFWDCGSPFYVPFAIWKSDGKDRGGDTATYLVRPIDPSHTTSVNCLFYEDQAVSMHSPWEIKIHDLREYVEILETINLKDVLKYLDSRAFPKTPDDNSRSCTKE